MVGMRCYALGLEAALAVLTLQAQACKVAFINDGDQAIFLSLKNLGPTISAAEVEKKKDVHTDSENYFSMLILPGKSGYIGLEHHGEDMAPVHGNHNHRHAHGHNHAHAHAHNHQHEKKQHFYLYVQDPASKNFIYKYHIVENYCSLTGNTVKYSAIATGQLNAGILSKISNWFRKLIGRQSGPRFTLKKI
jgi:hypothetical protein